MWMDVEVLGTALQRENDVEGGEEGNVARMLARKTAEQGEKIAWEAYLPPPPQVSWLLEIHGSKWLLPKD